MQGDVIQSGHKLSHADNGSGGKGPDSQRRAAQDCRRSGGFPDVDFERDRDDIVVHCDSYRQAQLIQDASGLVGVLVIALSRVNRLPGAAV